MRESTPSDNRTEPRAAVMVRVELSWEDGLGVSHAAVATLEDKSPRGVSVRVNEPVPVGARLQIKTPREQFSGIVTHYRRDGRGFLLGVQRNTIERGSPR